MSDWAAVLAATILDIPCQDTGATTALAGGGTLTNAGNASAISVADGPRADLPLSLQLDGSNDTIETALTLATMGSAFTVSAFVKVNAGEVQTTTDNYLFGTNGEGVGFSWGNATAGYRGSAYGRIAAGTYPAGAGPFTHAADAWIQYGLQWTGTELWGVKNGARIGSAIALASLYQTTDTLRFGSATGSTRFAAGRFAGLRVLSSADEALLAPLYAGPSSTAARRRKAHHHAAAMRAAW